MKYGFLRGSFARLTSQSQAGTLSSRTHLSAELLPSAMAMLAGSVGSCKVRNSENFCTRALNTPLSSRSCHPSVRLWRTVASPALPCTSAQLTQSPAQPLHCNSLKKAKASSILFPGSSVILARLQKIPNCRQISSQVLNLASLSLSLSAGSANSDIDVGEKIQESM